MKKLLISALLLVFSVAVFPALPVLLRNRETDDTNEQLMLREFTFDSEDTTVSLEFSDEPYKVLDIDSGNILEVPVRDYVIGAVCAEMPASFGEEALKAQAVAAHTYAERQRIRERENPSPELMGADFSNDTEKYQGYCPKSRIKEVYGEHFEENYKKISAAADEVLPYIITYENAPIIAAFHSMSPGFTESAENAWGTPVDYLVEVDSRTDMTAPKFREDKRYKAAELKAALEAAFDGVSLGDDVSQWLKILTISDSGTVLKASIEGHTVTGGQVRSALDLRSAAFDVRYEPDEIVITTKGYGHGVGMSQYGADAMAAEGSSWREIISHYYPGCSISLS
ncbi:stage II sporulation protein D [Ruminococcus flavefaciens]|uniref:stage II sporulation protein D n=1 Tax=Ruminococcus flavefaciens TaxID=1265 RepID=UPI0026F29A7A|nr:stage II sporulation protein D [Ruminococcus flavefaciens]